MNRIPIDLVMLLSLLLAAHHLKLRPPAQEPPPVTCNAQLVCK